MGMLKANVGTPLATTGLIDSHHLRKLQALSITTVEELLGIINADPDAMRSFLEVSNMAQLQADAVQRSMMPTIMSEQRRQTRRLSTLGAKAPKSVIAEDPAKPETFEANLAGYAPGPAGPPDAGQDLRSDFGPIRDQADRSTCVAHAGCALLEHLHRERDPSPDYSEQFLYWLAKENDGVPNEEGTWLEVAVPLMVGEGVCRESVWLYNPVRIPENESQGPPPVGAAADAKNFRAAEHARGNPRSSAQIREMLDEKTPVAISVPVYNNWYSNPNTKTSGLIPMPLPNSRLVGGHAMCAVGYGYDEDFAGGGYLILRNSWGTGWAPLSPIEPGYGAIPFSYVDSYGWEAFATL